jgi:hypothetical protein
MARIEDLRKLDDTPIERQVEALDEPCRTLLDTIEELLASDDHLWAYGTLTGIRETVRTTRRVSLGQERAIKHIAQRGYADARRRYEGYRGRGR